MKNTIKRALSAIIALVILGSITLTAGATAADLAKTQGSSSRIITDIDGLQDGEVYRIKHKNSGKYLTINTSTKNVTIETVREDDNTTQQWQYFYFNHSGHSYAKFRSHSELLAADNYFLDVDGSYSSTMANNTYLQNGINVAAYDNGLGNYYSSQWILDGYKLLASNSKYDQNTNTTFSSAYWKYLAPDPSGSGNVAQYGLSSLASGEAEWVYEKVIINNEPDNRYARPLPANNPSVPYYDMTWGYVNGHTGVDIATPVGTSVYAVKDGTVDYFCVYHKTNGWIIGGGMYAVLRIPDDADDDFAGEVVLYEHLSEYAFGVSTQTGTSVRGEYAGQYEFRLISSGHAVSKGDFIGKTGNTGNSSDPHLHLQLQTESGTVINPERLVAGLNLI